MNPESYLAPKLQEGTTPTVKLMSGKLTRDFRNLRHPRITEGDYGGPAAILGNRYKMVAPEGTASAQVPRELYDLTVDRGETNDISASHPDIVKEMGRQLRGWQKSVLISLTGADYSKRG